MPVQSMSSCSSSDGIDDSSPIDRRTTIRATGVEKDLVLPVRRSNNGAFDEDDDVAEESPSLLTAVAPIETVIAATQSCLRLQNGGSVCVCPICEETRARLLSRKRTRDRDGGNNDGTASTVVSCSTMTSTCNSTATAPAVKSIKETHLHGPVVATRSKTDVEVDDEAKLARMSEACRTILECIGEDSSRDGLVKTPERWAKALLFMTSGYALTPDQVINNAIFEESHDEMVVVRNIDVQSLCEHHMVPFVGRVHIGYIPSGKIIGLSKLARIAELYARRLQVQERLTRQIADAVVETVEPLGVAVVVECTHFCMVMRGVQKTGAVTTTSSVRGCFESNPKTRAEFFSIIHGSGVKMC